MRFTTLEECRDNLRHIQSALYNFHNGRGGPVFGLDSKGVWRQLISAREEKGIPYGCQRDDSADLVLRGVDVREK